MRVEPNLSITLRKRSNVFKLFNLRNSNKLFLFIKLRKLFTFVGFFIGAFILKACRAI